MDGKLFSIVSSGFTRFSSLSSETDRSTASVEVMGATVAAVEDGPNGVRHAIPESGISLISPAGIGRPALTEVGCGASVTEGTGVVAFEPSIPFSSLPDVFSRERGDTASGNGRFLMRPSSLMDTTSLVGVVHVQASRDGAPSTASGLGKRPCGLGKEASCVHSVAGCRWVSTAAAICVCVFRSFFAALPSSFCFPRFMRCASECGKPTAFHASFRAYKEEGESKRGFCSGSRLSRGEGTLLASLRMLEVELDVEKDANEDAWPSDLRGVERVEPAAPLFFHCGFALVASLFIIFFFSFFSFRFVVVEWENTGMLGWSSIQRRLALSSRSAKSVKVGLMAVGVRGR